MQIVTQFYILNRGITLIPTILVEDAIVSEIRMTRFLLEDRRSISHLFSSIRFIAVLSGSDSSFSMTAAVSSTKGLRSIIKKRGSVT